MRFYERERVGLFIDGEATYQALKSLGFDVDFKRLLRLLQSKCQLTTARYYTVQTIAPDGSKSVQPLVDWLTYNGFHVVTKFAKEFTNSQGETRFKGNIDIELVVDILDLAATLDHIVIFSGDSELTYLVHTLKDMGKCVTVVSTIATKPALLADSLRRAADQVLDLKEIQPLIARQNRTSVA